MTVAWLITHDEHIDRRIFFFADVFQELGFDVKLFSSFENGNFKEIDPPFVCRPEEVSIVKNYKNNNLINIEDLQDSEVRNIFSTIVSQQEEYFLQHNMYTKEIFEMDNFSLNNKQIQIISNVFEGYYNVAIKRVEKLDWYIYNNIHGKVRIAHQDYAPEVNDLEMMIYNLKKRILLGDEIPTKIEELFLENQIEDDIDRNMRVDGEKVILENKRIGKTVSYEYLSDEDIIRQKIKIPFSEVDNDKLLGNRYDFEEFRKIIFDYSPILSRIKKEIENNNEIVPEILYVADLPTLPIGYMLKDSLKCKLIVDCHEWWKEQSILWEPQNKTRINLMDKYEKMLYPKCDMRITVGKLLSAEMEDYFSSSFEHIYSCLTNAVEEEIHSRSKTFWYEKLGIPEGGKIAVFQGSLTTLRNLDNLAKSTKHLNEDNYLVVIGDGHYREEFEKNLRNHGNPAQVFFTGWVNQKELYQYTIEADLGILPYTSINHYYSLSVPNKLLEYYNAGIPILCDKTLLEVSRIVEETSVGVSVDCSDSNLFGKTINNILDNEELLNQFRNNYLVEMDKLSYKSQKEKFIKLIEELMSN